MPKFKITDSQTGKAVTVSGDSAPNDQEAEQIFKDAGLRNGSEQPSSIIDAIRSIPGGLAQGVAGTAGLPSTALNFISNKVGGLLGREEVPDTAPNASRFMGLPTSGQLNAAMSAPTGGYYKPQTTAGRYAETAASFAPAAIGGEASLAGRLLGRVLAPAAGSQLAGSAVDETTSPTLHGAATLGGALLGGGLAGGARALGGALLKDVPPDIAATNYLAKTASGLGATPETITQNAIPGRGQLGAEALGPNGVAMLATLGRRSGSTGEALGAALKERSAAAPSRILQDVSEASGIDPSSAVGNMENIVKAGRVQARPLYEAALNAPPATTDYLARFATDPDIKKGMAIGIRNAQREALAENKPFDPSAYAVSGFNEAGDPIISGVPTWRTWDAAKNGLDEMLEEYRNPITRQLDHTKTSIAIDSVRKSLLNELDGVNPAYKDARAAGADYLSANSAFKTGGDHLLNPGVTAKQVTEYVANLNPANLEAYKGGLANKLFNQAQNGRLRPNALLTPSVQQKLSVALGPDKAAKLIEGAQQELQLSQSGNRMMPGTGSITSDALLNAGEMDHGATLQAGMHGAKAMGHLLQGNVGGATVGALAAIKHFAPDLLRSGGMNADTRNELGRMLMLPPEDLATQLKTIPSQAPKNASALGRFLIGNR